MAQLSDPDRTIDEHLVASCRSRVPSTLRRSGSARRRQAAR
jgi:hypothetical protein